MPVTGSLSESAVSCSCYACSPMICRPTGTVWYKPPKALLHAFLCSLLHYEKYGSQCRLHSILSCTDTSHVLPSHRSLIMLILDIFSLSIPPWSLKQPISPSVSLQLHIPALPSVVLSFLTSPVICHIARKQIRCTEDFVSLPKQNILTKHTST